MTPQAEATMNHFSHPDHPLQLISNHQNSTLIPCSGCKSPATGGTVYGCKTCNYFLHADCAKMPREITHPFDKGHVFTLRQYGEGLYNYCDACGKQARGFCYHCKICKTEIHVHCASTPLTFIHSSHPHQLRLIFSPSHPDKKFTCDVCNIQGSNHWLYRCDICTFDVHLDCRKVPIQANSGAFPNQAYIPHSPCGVGVATGIPMNQSNIHPEVMAFIQRLEAALYSAQHQNRLYQQYYYQPPQVAYAHMAGGGGGGGFPGHGGPHGQGQGHSHGHGHGQPGKMQRLAQALASIATGIGVNNIPGLDVLANGGGGNLFDILGGNGVLSLFNGLDLSSLIGGGIFF